MAGTTRRRTAEIIGAVLVGGRSSRMGRAKPGVPVGGVTMLERVVGAIENAGLRPIAVGAAEPFGFLPGLETIPDVPGIGGPVGGLVAVLDYTGGKDVFLSAVDQPLLRPATIEALIACTDGDAVVPQDGAPQVTCAVYRAPVLPAARSLAGAGDRSLRHLLDLIDVAYVAEAEWRDWGEDGRSWFNANTPEDLAVAARRLTRG